MSNFYSVRELQKHYCSGDNAKCIDLDDDFDCGEHGVSCLLTGQCMSNEWICDSINDCGLWEDEVNCPGEIMLLRICTPVDLGLCRAKCQTLMCPN